MKRYDSSAPDPNVLFGFSAIEETPVPIENSGSKSKTNWPIILLCGGIVFTTIIIVYNIRENNKKKSESNL